jgi:hypothetical protein
MPCADTPNGLVAPFWMNLDPSAGGSVRYDVFGSAPNRWLVVEWNGVPQYGVPGSSYTFEAGVCENGKIRFQYGAMSEGTSSGSQATIGIEDNDGLRGVQYARDTAGSVYDGLAIEFWVPAGPLDSDTNGLPDAYERFSFGGIGHSPDADDDGDGMNNYKEFICGTDPKASSSLLRFLDNAWTTNGLVLNWQSVPGKQYNVERSSNVLSCAWSIVNTSPIVGGNSGTSTFTAPMEPTGRQLFYRIVVDR